MGLEQYLSHPTTKIVNYFSLPYPFFFFSLFSSSSDPSRIPTQKHENLWQWQRLLPPHGTLIMTKKYLVIFFDLAPLLEIIADRASPPMLSIVWRFNGNSLEILDQVQSSESHWKAWKFVQRSEPCNSLIDTIKSNLLTAPYFWLPRWFDWSKWVAIGSSLAISSLPLTCSPSFSFMGGVGKKQASN